MIDDLQQLDMWKPIFISFFYIKKLEKFNKKLSKFCQIFPKNFPISLLKNSKILLGKKTLVGGHHFQNLTNYN
jgi:hypothetical protein